MLLLITLVTGITYAIYNVTLNGDYNSITTGLVSMSYTESTNVISIEDALPMSDEEGKVSSNYFDFSVTSNLSLGQNDPNTTLNYLIEIEPLVQAPGYYLNENATEEQINQCIIDFLDAMEITEDNEEYEEDYLIVKDLCSGQPVGEFGGYSLQDFVDIANDDSSLSDYTFVSMLYLSIVEPSGVVNAVHEWTAKKNPTEEEINKCIAWGLEQSGTTEEDEDYEETYSNNKTLCSGGKVDGYTLQFEIDMIMKYNPDAIDFTSLAETGIIEGQKTEDGLYALRDNQIKVYLEDITNDRVIVNSKLVSSLNKHVLYSANHVHEYGTDSITTNYRLRAWVDYDTDASNWSETNRYEYKFRVNINGDVKKESLVCYTTEQITDDDSNVIGVAITGYNEACGTNVEIPETYSYVPVVAYSLVENPTQEAINNCTLAFLELDDEFITYAKAWCSGKEIDGMSLKLLYSSSSTTVINLLKDTGMLEPLYGAKVVDYPTTEAINNCTTAFLDYEGITEGDSEYKEAYSVYNTICSGGTYQGMSLNMLLSNLEYAAVFVPILANTGILEFGQASTTETQTYPVLEIRDSAFESSNLTSVKISSSVTTIGSKAFYDNKLTTISLSDNVTSVGDGAFTKNSLPESIAYIYARSDSDSDGVAEINNTKLVSYGGNQTDFNVPDTVTTIGNYAFDYSSFSDDKIVEAEIKRNCFTTSGSSITGYTCTDLQNVVIPEKIGNYSITTIGSQAFYQKNLKSAKIPATITSIDDTAFIYNYFIDFIEVDSNNTVYDSRDNSKVLIKTSTNHLMYGSNLGKVPNGVTSIGGLAFFMMNLEEIEIPEGVTSVGVMAFSYNNLKSIKIPSTLTSLDYNGVLAFAFNLDIESIVIDPGNTVYDSRDNSNAIIKTSTNEIMLGSNSTIIPNTVTSIASSAFADLNLTEIEIPDSVITIGYRAFSGNNLVNVTLGKNVKTIGDRAFRYNDIVSINLPSSLTSIGAYAFQDNNIESVVIPNSITTIGNYVFDENNLKSVTIPSGVTSIGTYAFGDNELTSVEIPNTVTSIGNYAFYNNNLTSVTMSDNVTTIGSGAFRNNSLTSITLPSKLTAIKDSSFSGNKLTSVTIPSSVTSIGIDAFYNNKLTSITIPNSVTTIGNYAFQSNSLTSLTLGNGVTSIGNYAFQSNSLTDVIIPSSVTSIGDKAFYNNKLTSVKIKGKSSSSGFTTYGTNIWGWASGYSDSNIVWNYTE